MLRLPGSLFRAAFIALLLPCLAGAALAAGDDVLKLPDYRLQGDPVEDFGFRVSSTFDPKRSWALFKTYTPVVDLVLPNTAASKAGIRPGDRIVLADDEPTDSNAALGAWRALQKKKWQQAREAAEGVTWTLALEDLGTGAARTVTLHLPTPPPRWGGPMWQAPEGRTAGAVNGAGPLAERARQILDHGIWMILRRRYVDGFDFRTDAARPLVLGYQWTLWDERGGHRMFVTQHRGTTDIVLEFIVQPNHRAVGAAPTESPDPTLASERTTLGNKAYAYLTSPGGMLHGGFDLAQNKAVVPGDARPGFEVEMEFWLQRVGKVSPRWPLELMPAPKEKDEESRAAGQ